MSIFALVDVARSSLGSENEKVAYKRRMFGLEKSDSGGKIR